MKSCPLDLIAAQVSSISSMTRSYMSDFVTLCPIGVLSLGEVKDMIAPRGNGCHLGVNAVDAFVSIHMQFSDKATSDKTDHYLWHRDILPSSKLIITGACLGRSALLK